VNERLVIRKNLPNNKVIKDIKKSKKKWIEDGE
jgi:hypothetical protein